VFVSFVVYARDDARELETFVPAVDRFLGEHFDAHEIVVVDDASDDDTAALLAGMEESAEGTLIHLRLARRHGTEPAMLAGLARAMGDFVFETGTVVASWELPLLLDLYDRAASGVDIVAASSGEVSWTRQRLFRAVNRYSYLELPEHPEQLRIVSRRALNAMLDLTERIRYRRALYALTGFPYAVVFYEPTRAGASLLRRARTEGLSRGFDVVVSFSDIGLRAARVLAWCFAALSVLVAIYAVLANLLLSHVAEGWTTLMLVASFGFTGLFLVLSLIGEYLARVLIEVRQRPAYVLGSQTTYPSHRQRRPGLPLTPLTTDAEDEESELRARRRPLN
jgi:dolichol-phosphate mannosyltransferase